MNKLNWYAKFAVSLVACSCVSTCYAQHFDRDNRLPDVPIPKVSDVESHMDVPKNEVIGWMDALQARVESLKYDCRIKADVSSVNGMNDGTRGLMGWNVALRRAKDPSIEAERYVTVRQNSRDNLGTNSSGVAEDKRLHYDVLRIGDKVFSTNVTAFDYHVSELKSEVEAKSLPSILKFLCVFDPIRACTSSATMVRDGYALETGQHSVLPRTVKSVLRDGEFVHVLLELSVLRSTDKAQMFYTFKDEVPVQIVSWDKVDKETGSPIPTEVTRSLWKAVKDGKDEQLLPCVIKGQVDKSYAVANMEIFLEWDLGRDVDDSLFSVDSLGKLPPAADVVFDMPNKFEEIVKEIFDK